MIGFTNMPHMISVLFQKAFSKFNLVQFTAEANPPDLDRLATLLKEGKIKPHLERIFSYKEILEAISFIEEMRTRGKVVADWD